MPEDRSNPNGREVQVFVVRLEPNKPTTAPPVIYVGSDLGLPMDYFGLAGMTDHLDGPEVISMEARGTGYSEPNLSCPEVDALAAETLRAPIDDPPLRNGFTDAVAACYQRFTDQGIDLSDFGVEEAGADLLDLVDVLGLKEWDVITKGSTSRIAFQAMRANPPGLRAVVAYNPEFPDTDMFAQMIEGTRAAIAQLATLCEDDSACGSRYPHLEASFNEAIRRFDVHPQTVRIKGKDIVVDGARLLRDFRNVLATVAADNLEYRRLPATIDALAYAKNPTSSLVAVVSAELSAPTFCTGYLPTCGSTLNQGAFYSTLCADIAPLSDTAELTALAGEEPAWTVDYVNGPYRDLCSAWQVDPAGNSVTTVIRTDVAMLVFSGGLDPTMAPDAVRDGVAGFPNAFLVVTPIRSHPVTTIPACPEANPRNEFLALPTSAPDTGCEQSFQPRFASSPL